MFINSNLDIDLLSIVNDNKSEKVCSLCKNTDKSNENPKTVVDESVKSEKFNDSDTNNLSLDQNLMKRFYVSDVSHKNLSKLSVDKIQKLLLEVQTINKKMISDDLIKSIKSLDSSIEFEEDSQFFLLEKIDLTTEIE